MSLMSYLLIILSLITAVDTQSTCKDRDCFDCVSIDKCKWEGNQCKKGVKDNDDKSKWYLKYEVCENDSASIATMDRYCFSAGINSIPLVATLIKVNNFYSRSNLFCKWVIPVSSPRKNTILILADKSNESFLKNDKYVVNYHLSDNTKSTTTIDSFSYNMKSSKIKRITFFYYSPEGPHLNIPFTLHVNYDNTMAVYDIVIFAVAFCLGVILIGIIIVTIFHCIKYIKIKRKRQNNLNNEIQIQTQQIEVSSFIPNMKNQFIHSLMPVPYALNHQNIGTVCTICFEDFINDVSVVILRCTHLFHYNCMSDYIIKAKVHLRCPNCNVDLIENKNNGSDNVPLNQHNILTGRDDELSSRNTNSIQIISSNFNNGALIRNSNNDPSISTGMDNRSNNNEQQSNDLPQIIE